VADDWWATFFDDDYTDVWAGAGMFEDTEEEARGVLDLVGGGEGLRILDIPCGFGRHAAVWHRLGHTVTGVDASPDQLAIAAARHPGPTYLQGDLRHPPEGPYDVVCNLFSSFGYFCDRRQDLAALRAWHAVLRPRGVLVMELLHRDRLARLIDEEVERPVGDTGAVEVNRMDWVSGINTSTVTLADGRQRTFRLRVYTVTELVDLLTDAGFTDLQASGGFNGGPVTPETRLVVVGRRPQVEW
jgi:SAM-dependent methyltransferase